MPTSIWVILLTRNISSALTASSFLSMYLGDLVIMLAAISPSIVLLLFSILRISPSVIIPFSFPSSTTATAPSLFLVISMITSFTVACEDTKDFSFCAARSPTVKYKRFPKEPPG